MILDNVANRAGLVVKRTPPLHAEVLRHRDLHALDVMAVPDRFQERVGEAEEHHVMHLPLPKIMVDPEDRCLVKGAEQESIQLLRRGEIVAEWFFDNYPGARRAARFDQLFHNSAEQYWRNRQVMRGMSGVLELFAQRLKRRRVLVVASHVA